MEVRNMESDEYVFEYWEVKQYFKEDCEEWGAGDYNYTPGQIVGRSVYEWGGRVWICRKNFYICRDRGVYDML